MSKLFWMGVLLLTLGQFSAVAQAPPLDTFISPDGAFQFVYPESYDLLVGERILRATQGRQQSITVCNFSTALVCVIYPIETEEETRFEAAGFSVDAVPGVTNESDCLNYSDQTTQQGGEALKLTSISINEHIYHHASARRKTPGHLQAADLYRTFHHDKCYELQVEVSLAEAASAPQPSRLVSLGDAKADSARESLRLILSSFAFKQ